MIGKTLGHYTVSALIGRGGMGEVYKAKDQKLGRDVAIKVLPEEFAKDADRVARFQREAKLLASLNHPNIASIYGLEESDGTHFLVLELIEGDTLADRIKTGPIPVEESLKLALQIAEALEAAHEKGVIHRDLKPANIKVTPDNKIKVLDFGLAKAFAGEQEEMILSDSPTLSVAATRKGVILGTAAYMSPEQAKGKSLDKRTDVWAFGCVLYEMLTGRAAFQGEDVTEILASVVKASVNLSLLPERLHPKIREAIGRCLQKDLRKRYAGISDVEYEIEEVLGDKGGVFVEAVAEAKPKAMLRQMLPWIAVTAILSIVIAGVAAWYLKPAKPLKVITFEHEIPEDQELNNPIYPVLAVSPDGYQFVYSTSAGLCLRSLNELAVRVIVGADEIPSVPFFSPDGEWLGYRSGRNNQLKKISVSGGASSVLCEVGTVSGASWNDDNTIVYATTAEGIFKISANGGTPEILVKVEDSTLYHPRLLPDGKSLLFTLETADSPQFYQVAAQSLESGERRILFNGDCASYLPTKHLIYASDNDLYAVPFDLERLEATGTPVLVIEDLFRMAVPMTAPQYSISNSGTLVYITSPPGAAPFAQRNLLWVDRNGKEEIVDVPPNAYSFPRISPDGNRVALCIGDGTNVNLHILDLYAKNLGPLTFNSRVDSFPLWAPDGKHIAFASTGQDMTAGIFWKAADGTGEVESLVSDPQRLICPCSWSDEDGEDLIFGEAPLPNLSTRARTLARVMTFSQQGAVISAEMPLDIGMLSMEGESVTEPLLNEKHWETNPQVSPDGQWVAYVSNERGISEVFVRPFPDVSSGKWQISSGGGDSPLWAKSGRELLYHSNDSYISVEVQTEPTFKKIRSRILFKGDYYSSLLRPLDSQWDIHPDGKRFLMLKPYGMADEEPTSSQPHKINVVLNFFEELKERVPVD